MHFKSIPKTIWEIIQKEFGGLEILREKDKNNFSYFNPKYKYKHEFLRLFILPPWDEFDTDLIANQLKIKVFYNQEDTFNDIKKKTAAYLS